jgi:D-threo-aldose 1-dehydrogenase
MPQITQAKVGRTNVDVTTLSLGTAPLGNLFTPVSDADAAAVLRCALDAGVRHFDTAPHYGVGLAEERVGRALEPEPPGSYTVATKAGRLLSPLQPGETEPEEGYVQTPRRKRTWDLTEAGMRQSLEDSLDRMGLDRIDILYLHDPDDFEAEALATAIPALVRMRDEGLIGAVGAGMNQAEMLTRFVREIDIDLVLCAGRYTLLDQRGLSDLLPACVEHGVSVMLGGAFNSGLLANPRPGATFNYTTASAELVAKAQALQEVCQRHDVPLTAAALQFPLAHPAVVAVLTGPRNPIETTQNIEAFQLDLPDTLWADFRSSGLVPEDVPLPGLD